MEQRRHLMNYGLGENLTLSTLGHLVVSATYLGIRIENLGKFDAKFDVGIFLGYSTKSKTIIFIIKIHKSSRNPLMWL